MTELKGLVDAYSLRARVLPAALVTMPAGITLAVLLPGFDYKSVTALAVSAGLPIFAANTVRSRGKHLEDRLKRHWGGMPTTRMLRLTEPTNDPVALTQRRAGLEQLTEEPLPTLADEQADLGAADQHYRAATRTLIARVRETKDKFDLVQKENIDFGFRRNLTAMKPLGLVVLGALLLADVGTFLIGASRPGPIIAAAGVVLLCTLGWVTVVRWRWVLEQGNTYAERLFEALDDPDFLVPAGARPDQDH